MSDIRFGIRVVDEDGDGVVGARVFISYPWTWEEEYTDEDGWAQFERDRTMHGGVYVDIFVNGEEMAKELWIDEGDYVTYCFAI